MANLDQILEAMKTVIRADWPEVLFFAEDPVGGIDAAPAIWAALDPEKRHDFNGSFGVGMVTWYFNVRVLVDRDSAQEMNEDQLRSMIDLARPNSIPRLLHEEVLADGQTTFHVEGIRDYGASYADGSPLTGAQIDLTVRTPATTF